MKKLFFYCSPSTIPFLLLLLSSSLLALLFLVVHPNDFRLQSFLAARCSRPTTPAAAILAPVTPQPEFRLLMGILSLPDSFERRHLLRTVYALQRPDLDGADVQIDVRFVFCNLTTDEQRVLVAAEILLHDDIIILDCAENMDNGKTYTYFSSVPYLFDETPYHYVMKADDDTYFRLRNLAESLRRLPRRDVYYGLINPCSIPQFKDNYMSGMGYALSWDLVEWVAGAEVARQHRVGPEDVQTGMWMREGGRGRKYNMEPAMYDYFEEPWTCYRHRFVPDTIAVHKLKSNLQWARTLEYFNVTAVVKPSKLYHLH